MAAHIYVCLVASTVVAKLMAAAVAVHEDVHPGGLVPERGTLCFRRQQAYNFLEDPDPEGPAPGLVRCSAYSHTVDNLLGLAVEVVRGDVMRADKIPVRVFAYVIAGSCHAVPWGRAHGVEVCSSMKTAVAGNYLAEEASAQMHVEQPKRIVWVAVGTA